MDCKPLSYESLKTVIQHMDPNARFQIRQKCPSIRITEGLVPLKIIQLELNPHHQSITIDGISYKLGIITQYHNADETPDYVKMRNNIGGVVYDVDRYSLKYCTADMTPGDLLIGHMERFDYEADRELNQQVLTQCETVMAILNQKRVEQETLPKTQEVLSFLKRIDNLIKELMGAILPYQLRQNNVQPRFTNYLQFIVKGSDEKIEKMENNQKIGDSMKYLTNKLLGGRGRPILVDHLNIISPGCFRLPENLKLVIRKMSVLPESRETLDAFLPILHKRSFPLKTIFIDLKNDFDHQIIKSAEEIVMQNLENTEKISTIEKIAFSHPRIHFERNVYYTIHIIQLVKWWEERGRDIGTHYSFEIEKKSEVYRILDFMEKYRSAKLGELDEIRLSPFPKCVTVSLSDYSEINIYGEEVKKNVVGLLQWILHVKVHKIGQATPLNVEPPLAKRAKLVSYNHLD